MAQKKKTLDPGRGNANLQTAMKLIYLSRKNRKKNVSKRRESRALRRRSKMHESGAGGERKKIGIPTVKKEDAIRKKKKRRKTQKGTGSEAARRRL